MGRFGCLFIHRQRCLSDINICLNSHLDLLQKILVKSKSALIIGGKHEK